MTGFVRSSVYGQPASGHESLTRTTLGAVHLVLGSRHEPSVQTGGSLLMLALWAED